MTRGTQTLSLSAILCADWGKESRKRAVYVADVAARVVRRVGTSGWLQQSEAPKCLLDSRNLFWWARILFGRTSGFGEAKQLFAVQEPSALGHETVLAQNPLLDFLICGPLTGWLLFVGVVVRRAPGSSIVLANAHSTIRRGYSITCLSFSLCHTRQPCRVP